MPTWSWSSTTTTSSPPPPSTTPSRSSRACAARFHLVVASRSDPPFPLARLRARGDLLEIRAADLRFTTDEAAAYFNDAMGLRLMAEDVDALDARTEGWIAALQLAALSLQGRDDVAGFIANFTGNDRFVVDYLVEEVLERQPDAVRDFLLADVGPPSAHRVALRRPHGRDRREGHARGARSGQPLRCRPRRSSSLVPLPPPVRRRAPRPVARRAARAGGRLHLRASTWYDANGDAAEAIQHALAGRALRAGGRAHRAGDADHAPDPSGRDVSPLARSRPRRSFRRPAGADHRAGRRPHGHRRPDRRPVALGRRRALARRARSRRAEATPSRHLRRSCSTTTSSPDCPPRSRSTAPGWRSSPAIRPAPSPTQPAPSPSPSRPTISVGARPPPSWDWRTGRWGTSTRPAVDTPRPSTASSGAGYIPDLLGCSPRAGRYPNRPGSAAGREADLRGGPASWPPAHGGARGTADVHVGLASSPRAQRPRRRRRPPPGQRRRR